jgi:hypothetical protein
MGLRQLLVHSITWVILNWFAYQSIGESVFSFFKQTNGIYQEKHISASLETGAPNSLATVFVNSNGCNIKEVGRISELC